MNSKDTIMKLLSEAWKYRWKGNYKESKLLLEQQSKYEQALQIWEEVKEMYSSLQVSAGIAEAESKIEQLKGIE